MVHVEYCSKRMLSIVSWLYYKFVYFYINLFNSQMLPPYLTSKCFNTILKCIFYSFSHAGDFKGLIHNLNSNYSSFHFPQNSPLQN